MKRALVILFLGMLVGLAFTLLAVQARLAPVVADPGAPGQLFVVNRGASLSVVARSLEEAGLVRDARTIYWLGRTRGLAAKLRAGEYRISPAQAPGEILDTIVAGRIATYPVALPEGFTAIQIAARLQAAGLASAAEFQAVVRDATLARDLGIPAPSLEGYLYPETYQFPHGLAASEIARVMVEHFKAAWRDLEPASRERGLDMHEVVTLASIVEKETGAPEERPIIASVFANRLARRMRLESDPTVIYGIPDFDGNLRRRDLEDESNPYNTYRIPALPPGPIANPGLEALRAVVDPAESEYLFFVSRNDGTHVFSKSYREHERNVDRYQRRRAK